MHLMHMHSSFTPGQEESREGWADELFVPSKTGVNLEEYACKYGDDGYTSLPSYAAYETVSQIVRMYCLRTTFETH
jgi:hypothetical protein